MPVPKDRRSFHLELVLKVRLPKEARQVVLIPLPAPTCIGMAKADRSRSRRKRTLLSFQRPDHRPGDAKKEPPTRARGLRMLGLLIPNRPRGAPVVWIAGTFQRRPFGQ